MVLWWWNVSDDRDAEGERELFLLGRWSSVSDPNRFLFLHPQMHEVNEVESAMLGLAAKTILHVLETRVMVDVDVTIQCG